MKVTRRTVLKTLALTTAGTFTDPTGSTLAEALPQADEPLTDPQRPAYHLQPARGWMNDPCGPIYWHGQYHMFHQYNPHAAVWGDMNWAHAVSPDMIHWQRLPIALAPTPAGPDAQGCFTGTAVVQDGRPTLLYTGVRTAPLADATLPDPKNPLRESQCLAVATDDTLRTWKKLPTPVIAAPPPGMKVAGFRDPSPWRDGNTWYLIVGSGIPHKGGMILLYRSADLRTWEYLHPLLEGTWNGVISSDTVDTGEMWECPDFFPLTDAVTKAEKHVFIHSSEGKVLWQSGTLDRNAMRFHPEKTGELDYGRVGTQRVTYYAPKTQLDAQGNRILWGWIAETRPEADYSRAGWSGLMSLPRILTLYDGELHMQPASQTERLRGLANTKPATVPNLRQEFHCILQPETEGITLPYIVADPTGPILDIRSDSAQPPLTLRFDDLSIAMPEPLSAQASLHVFIDNSVVEAFIESRFCVTRRFYARTPGKPIATLILPGHLRVVSPQSFSLNSIWET